MDFYEQRDESLKKIKQTLYIHFIGLFVLTLIMKLIYNYNPALMLLLPILAFYFISKIIRKRISFYQWQMEDKFGRIVGERIRNLKGSDLRQVSDSMKKLGHNTLNVMIRISYMYILAILVYQYMTEAINKPIVANVCQWIVYAIGNTMIYASFYRYDKWIRKVRY